MQGDISKLRGDLIEARKERDELQERLTMVEDAPKHIDNLKNLLLQRDTDINDLRNKFLD